MIDTIDWISGSITVGAPGLGALVACTIASLILGFLVAVVYRFRQVCSRNLATTLVLLPAMVQIIIMLVDGNIGVGIAVAGAFSLIRFRSIAGNARDIGFLFFSMSLGFVTGLGFLLFAFVFFFFIGLVAVLLTCFPFSDQKENMRLLRIRIPENLDYESLFDEVFAEYAESAELESVRTAQMGSLYELRYLLRLKSDTIPKAFIDALRVRNSNLTIFLNREVKDREEL